MISEVSRSVVRIFVLAITGLGSSAADRYLEPRGPSLSEKDRLEESSESYAILALATIDLLPGSGVGSGHGGIFDNRRTKTRRFDSRYGKS